jgi:hypothetical protein
MVPDSFKNIGDKLAELVVIFPTKEARHPPRSPRSPALLKRERGPADR